MIDRSYNGLTQLGKETPVPTDPDHAILERAVAPAPDENYLIRFTCPEFTSLCPITSQPDFALIVIDYIPDAWIIESKSLKLYMSSFRSHATFHEACTLRIGQTIVEFLSPRWFRIGAYWFPRGGIPIDVFWQSAPPPDGVWLPEQCVSPYRGRG